MWWVDPVWALLDLVLLGRSWVLCKMEGTTTRIGLNKMGLSKKRKEGRGIKNSLLCGGDEDDVLTDEDVLGLSSGGVSKAVLEFSLTLSLFGCQVQK